MNKKYFVNKLKNFDLWKSFEKDSPQSSIFSSIELLENFKKNLDLYSINKGSELKSLVYLLKEKKNIISDPLIYSGMLFSPQKNKKIVDIWLRNLN